MRSSVDTRDRSDKWPVDPDELRSVYPDDGEFLVRILGGASYAEKVLGAIPPNWEVYQFGSISPREFLERIDFFVYYHLPDLVEAFGRTILEAMATGAPAILPSHVAELFGDAAIYAEPAGVRSIVRELRADWPRYQGVVAEGRRTVWTGGSVTPLTPGDWRQSDAGRPTFRRSKRTRRRCRRRCRWCRARRRPKPPRAGHRSRSSRRPTWSQTASTSST